MRSRAQLEQENHRFRQVLLAHESTIKHNNAALENKDTLIEQLKQALILARNARFSASSESLRLCGHPPVNNKILKLNKK